MSWEHGEITSDGSSLCDRLYNWSTAMDTGRSLRQFAETKRQELSQSLSRLLNLLPNIYSLFPIPYCSKAQPHNIVVLRQVKIKLLQQNSEVKESYGTWTKKKFWLLMTKPVSDAS
ncbi:hypothetical protein [Roseofilum reptotaenium]|uniref:hypothetical protein n=1 Tax=Roseofilum reptotaenium TaxID=1233427 RepID=UPI0023308D1F|nr:hypothetical protein [Roseofilum reptotaenium]